MWTFFYKMSSGRSFYQLSGRFIPFFALASMLLFAYGLVGGLWLAPPDFQQGDAFRIIYIHVPSAFLSLMIFSVMTFCAVLSLVWRIKMADLILQVSCPLGAWFTALALATGSIWGKPMWGTYWVWDARLTSELILLFIYFGVIVLSHTIPEERTAAKASAILTLVGFVDIPIIHFSVNWWNTLHQGDTLKIFSKSTIAPSMLHPLLAMIGAFAFFYGWMCLSRARSLCLLKDKRARWVEELVKSW